MYGVIYQLRLRGGYHGLSSSNIPHQYQCTTCGTPVSVPCRSRYVFQPVISLVYFLYDLNDAGIGLEVIDDSKREMSIPVVSHHSLTAILSTAHPTS